ncbi:hypothetical protein Y032_0079g1285 [Ancylostoma ceylanicum]|uniref:Glucosylceramidase n=1 Tax=Ancylostoma ceylanicum TaxID=53326 RepID=A0A016TUA1_9BILA|nr:hypothetical protein Y032_0079g1285 [Ancylostoma ceylanicum]
MNPSPGYWYYNYHAYSKTSLRSRSHFCLADRPCAQKIYGSNPNNIVCMCNATYCDEIQPVMYIPNGGAIAYVSSMSGKRFQKSVLPLEKSAAISTIRIEVDARRKHQSIIGFGGSFTDAAGINMAALSPGTRRKLMESYFGKNGIEYNLARVPIASTDFSTREYSYSEVPGDMKMSRFSLAPEDFKYKIPYILSAMDLTGGNLRLYASPWSAPGWMKTNGRMKGGGPLKGNVNGEYYQAYAKYFVRFFEEYAKYGIRFWGMTLQNEPIVGGIPYFPWQSMHYTAEMQRDFMKGTLGPMLKRNRLTKDLKVMVYDESRTLLPSWADTVYNDPEATKYVDGIGVHWYVDTAIPATVLTSVHERHPEKFILATEACTGAFVQRGPLMGDWGRAQEYAVDIIEDLNHFVAGWTDWNLCLDGRGGPNWVDNFVDSPIIVNAKRDEFYKQPMFYAMGHFSKFIKKDAVRLETRVIGTADILATSVTHQGRRTLVLVNKYSTPHVVTVDDLETGRHLRLTVDPRSIITVLWDRQ